MRRAQNDPSTCPFGYHRLLCLSILYARLHRLEALEKPSRKPEVPSQARSRWTRRDATPSVTGVRLCSGLSVTRKTRSPCCLPFLPSSAVSAGPAGVLLKPKLHRCVRTDGKADKQKSILVSSALGSDSCPIPSSPHSFLQRIKIAPRLAKRHWQLRRGIFSVRSSSLASASHMPRCIHLILLQSLPDLPALARLSVCLSVCPFAAAKPSRRTV
ncbi:hypothetical protein IWX49DRAFT_291225 [Phyllosticta citricarpa]|uniref:Uncharacterized protein n=1 Tax=Phyllosticta paracitricarpa TaxID=2016321 RepID=A0ABR1NG74_9PEZI